jgi:serine/threonine protein kinase
MNSHTVDPLGSGAGQSMNAALGANTVVGQYILERPLGEGGMAEVWLARNVHLGTSAAIKFLNRAYAGNREIEQRFLNEGRRQGALNDPHIVKVYGFEYVGGRSCLILQYIDGEPLDRRLQRLGRLDAFETVRIATGVLNALECAHDDNIVHRDVKPSNILLDAKGFPYLGDFGIVLAMNEQRVTKDGTVMGTSYYMSPEQITTPARVDPRADIYSFGCVLYEMLCGRPPFEVPGTETDDTDFAIKMAHVQQTPPPLRQFNPGISPEIESVVMRCLAKNRDYRWRTCGELRAALAAAAAAGVQDAEVPPPRQNHLWILAALLPLLLLTGLALWFWPTVTVDKVAICQGTFNPSDGTCKTDPASRLLTVYAPFHDAKPGKSTMRSEWEFGGKVVRKLDPHILSLAKDVYSQPFGTADMPGDYKVTVFADRTSVGSANIHISLPAVPVFAIGAVSICQGAYDTSTVTCRFDPSSRLLTVYVPYHNAKPLDTVLRIEWLANGKIIRKSDAHFLRYKTAVYSDEFRNVDPGDYKVAVYGTNVAPLGSAMIHVAPPIPPPISAAFDSVSICQGRYDSSAGSCATDPLSRNLTVVAQFHDAMPGLTKATAQWVLNARVVWSSAYSSGLPYSRGTYSASYGGTTSEPGDYKVTVFLDGAPAGSAHISLGPVSSFVNEGVTICWGSFDVSSGVCRNNPSSKVLAAVMRFHGATPGQTRVRAEWTVNGLEIKKSEDFALRSERGWYGWRLGKAPLFGEYKVTVYVDGVVRGTANTHVGY